MLNIIYKLNHHVGGNLGTIKGNQSKNSDDPPSECIQPLSSASKIEYCDSQILGKGSGRTIIYKGTFGLREVAVKKIPHFQFHKDAENEIDFLIKCSGHPNIVQYYASERRPDGYYLALELCHGKTLKDWVKNNFLSVKVDGVNILRQVTKGLKFLQAKGIIHSDLKQSNILFSIIGDSVFVKLCDFGISRVLAAGNIGRSVTSFGGTPGWIAAEMLAAEAIYQAIGTWNDPQMPKLVWSYYLRNNFTLYYKYTVNH